MKMLKKLLAVVLTGAMALTLLTACGSNAVNDKNIADALNDMAKAQAQAQANGQDTYITFTPRAKEREMARQLAALLESKAATATVADGDNDFADEANNILGCKEGGANANNFVWFEEAVADEIGTGGQVYQFAEKVLDTHGTYAYHSQRGKTPANDRYMGTALCKVLDHESGKMETWRIIVITAKAVDKK